MSNTWQQQTKSPEKSDENKRINVLFSPFRKRELNPVDYDSKLNFWKEAINKLCEEKKWPTFSVTSLQNDFARNNKSPSCIPTVLDELIKIGEIMALEHFLKMNPEESWGSWAVNSFLVTPAVWSFGKLMEALDIGKDVDSSNVYVSVRYVKKLGMDVFYKVNQEENIMTREDFNKLVDDGNLHDSTTNLVLHWLKVDRKAISHESNGRQLIKVSENVKPFTETEVVTLLLQNNRNRLVSTIETLEKEKKDCMELVRKQLREGSKILAKSSLRRSKELEKAISKKCSALDNLESLIVRIRETKSDSQVYEAYQFGLNALKGKLKENGLDEDTVSDTMTEIQEITEMHENIQSSLMLPVTPGDESQLEDELNEILSSSLPKEAELGKIQDISLPDVPLSPLSTDSQNKTKELKLLY